MAETVLWGTIGGREITFPMEVPDLNALTILFTVDRDAATALVPGDAFEVVETAPGAAQLVVAACDYRDNPWGDYNELNLGFLVRPAGAGDDAVGSFVYRMPVDQPFTCEAGNRVMGFPKSVERIDVGYGDGHFSFVLRAADGAPAVTLAAPRAAPLGPPERLTAISYSYLDGVPHATTLEMAMGTGLVDPADLAIELGSGLVADELRALGLPAAPDLCTWGEGLSATFHLGRPVASDAPA